MDVFVIPVGSDRYELYYEQQFEETEPDEEPASTGVFARLQRRFGAVLRAAEERQHRGTESVDESESWMGRIQDRLLSWMAERIVEQRLLWNLRKQTTVVAVHPRDMDFDAVLAHIRGELHRDYERHRFWLVLDTIGMIVSWPLTVIPGPNVLLFYFMFRVGGHWLSMRGAMQGRSRVTWTSQASDALVDVRAALSLDGTQRQERISQIAETLHLSKLPAFFERVTLKHTTHDSTSPND
jgi:Mitochondrial K+-H+ exchange-related